MGDLGSIPGLGRSPAEGKGYLLQYSGLENSKDCIPWSSMGLQRVGYELYLLRASYMFVSGLAWWHSEEESTCQCRGHGFDPWSRKIPHAMGQPSLCAPTTELTLSRAYTTT